MTAKTHHSMTLRGVSAVPVTVRAEPSDKFEIVGLNEAAAREARVRVHAALSRLEGLKARECKVRVTVTGADGSCPAADLAVAVAVLDADQAYDAPTFVVPECQLDEAAQVFLGNEFAASSLAQRTIDDFMRASAGVRQNPGGGTKRVRKRRAKKRGTS